MTTFARLNGLTSILFTPMLMSLAVGIMTTIPAHAEQYCKSVDQSGNASYTLAPESGCNKKKFKTVAVSHHITPQVAASATNAQSEKPAGGTPAGSQTTPTNNTPTVAATTTPEATKTTPAVTTATVTTTKISTVTPPTTKQPSTQAIRRSKDCTTSSDCY